MKFEIFQCMFWRDRIYLLPTIVIDSGDAQYRCKNLAIEFHFLFWNMRWLWLELEQKPCEDAVSRQTVLNEVRAIATWHSGDAFNEDRVIRHMKMLPSVLPKREQGGWISVKDRLPDKNTAVLTYVNTGMTTTYCLAHLNSLGEWKDWIGYELIEKERLYEVLAWMPLPEPIRRVRNKHGRH